MLRYIVKRVGYMLFTLFIIVTITFFMMRSIPGDPLANYVLRMPEQTRELFKAKYGLDKPLFTQYLIYLKGLLSFDLGDSLVYLGRSVSDTIAQSSPVSGLVGGIALGGGLLLGILFGIFAALFKNKWPDYVVMVVAILGVTIPNFVLASLLQYLFAVKWGLLPTSGWGKWQHLVLPAICLSFGVIATYARYLKSSMLDVLNQDYVLTAESKGVSSFNVIRKHVLRNAVLPVVTLLGGSVVHIFTGAFIIEGIFSVPGIGFYYIASVNNNDYMMTMGTTVFYAILFIVMQLLVDIIYGLVDPRIRLANRKQKGAA